MDYVKKLKIDKEILKSEISSSLQRGSYVISSISHPAYLDLKYKLQAIPDQTREDRKQILKLTYELLELYWLT